MAKLGIQIGAAKRFAIKFAAADAKYDVYHNAHLQADGYVLDLSQQVTITVEIANPFTARGKTLGLQFRDDANRAKYYQGAGGFKVVVADGTGMPTHESAQRFLETALGDSATANALELVYLVFRSLPSAAEVAQLVQPRVINDPSGP